MPRAPRIHFPGALFHVTTRGNCRQKIFLDEKDYSIFKSIIRETKRFYPFFLFAYCLMPNHPHLLIQVEEISISRILHRILTVYANKFNLRHKRIGHLFQGRFHSILCDKNTYLLELIRYIHLNPVRSSLVKAPKDWKWSSHNEYISDSDSKLVDCAFPLSLFSDYLTTARDRYSKFVMEKIQQSKEKNKNCESFSNAEWTEKITVEPLSERTSQLHDQPISLDSLEEFAQSYAAESDISVDSLKGRNKHRKIAIIRRGFIHAAIKSGYMTTQIARILNISHSAVSKAFNTH